jgi:hypothetical protein
MLYVFDIWDLNCSRDKLVPETSKMFSGWSRDAPTPPCLPAVFLAGPLQAAKILEIP